MEHPRWEEIAELCGEALELPPSDRNAFLRARCGVDSALQREVESLLSIAGRPGVLDSPVLNQDFQPGSAVAGRFRIVRWLGRGGMGEVYEAEDLHLGGRVALKTVRAEMLHRPHAIELFKREIQVAKRVTHPNVCRIYDIGFHPSTNDPDARMFLTMEFLEGRTLSSRLRSGPMTTAESLPIIEQLTAALGAAHRAGVVHRDFKSANVMLVPQSDGALRAVVMDFGLARTTSQFGGTPTNPSTETLGAVGTPEYMAPEQLTGGAITPSTDIYALGIVIYEMVTGSRPFQGETPFEVAVRRLHEPPLAPRQLRADLPLAWEETILRCLSRLPEARFQDTSEVFRSLSGEAQRRRIPWRAFAPLASATVLLGIVAGLLWFRMKDHSEPRIDWQQLTNFSDAATDPAFSPDGRMVAFKRGGSWFLGPGQIYVKVLPNGQPVQLTHDASQKMVPVFSPDGTKIMYTALPPGSGWEIWEASVLQGGGEPHRMLTNAEGLTWIDDHNILFSEQGPDRMYLVTSTPSRTSTRNVYVPGQHWMAHFSAISPDRKQVLIAEMQPGSEFGPCRLAPFDGSSQGKQVGPIPGHCIAAAWSPDGKWIYFSARRDDEKFHLWRQRADGGDPQQITSGPNQEQGIAIAPDGRSAISSVGVDRTSVWLHDGVGEHQISGEGDAVSPRFSPDGNRVFYLTSSRIWVVELASGHTEMVFPDVLVSYYDLSPDGKAVAFATTDGALWYAPVDRGTPPRMLASRSGRIEFSSSGEIFFHSSLNSVLYAIQPDGTRLRTVPGNPGDSLHPLTPYSPDGEWSMHLSTDKRTLAFSRRGGPPVVVCDGCFAGWTHDGKFFWITLQALVGQEPVTGLFPLKRTSALPPVPAGGIRTRAQLMKIPGVVMIASDSVSPAPDGSSYAFVKQESRWNLYRISLP